jgi:hypothetical protein
MGEKKDRIASLKKKELNIDRIARNIEKVMIILIKVLVITISIKYVPIYTCRTEIMFGIYFVFNNQ